jgi:hypothetical protein
MTKKAELYLPQSKLSKEPVKNLIRSRIEGVDFVFPNTSTYGALAVLSIPSDPPRLEFDGLAN